MNQSVPDLSQSLSQFGFWKPYIQFLLSPAQDRLIQIAKKEPWRSKLMEELYLSNRRSMMFYSNVVYLFENDPRTQDPISRSALIAAAAYQFYKNHGQESEYQFLFSTARIPGKKKDSRHHSKNKNHLIVSIYGNCYLVTLDNTVTFAKLRNTFEQIKFENQHIHQKSSAGIFTSLPRKKWYHIYKNLEQENLNLVNSSILFICIDLETLPKNRQEKLWYASYGNAHNRWYDKTHQFIILGDGSASLNRDHTWIDGKSTLNYVSKIWQASQNIQLEINASRYHFKPLNFKLPSPKKVLKQIQKEQINRALICFDIEDLGEDFWRKKSLSPNGIMQLAIQRAAFLTYQRWFHTSEAVGMSHLSQGRYETIWTLTPESKKFIDSSLKKSCDLESLLSQLYEALNAYKKRVKASKIEQGPVFHLTALAALSSIPWMSKIVHCEITTSNPGYQPGCELGCFTDTEKNIIGICYFFQKSTTRVSIKSDGGHRYRIEQFKNSLIESLRLFQKFVSDPI